MSAYLLVVSFLSLLWLIRRRRWRRLQRQPLLEPPVIFSDLNSSSSNGRYAYKVFLSFTGVDVRGNFLSHLYKELKVKGIYTFKDDPALKRGDSISEALKDAISGSAVSVVILSENYASSSWCLEELDHIMKCKKSKGQVVIPIFYKVDPSNVRKQRGSFGDAMRALVEGVKHNHNYEEEMEKIRRWSGALTEVGKIAGWDSRGREEATMIEHIVQDISDKLICSASKKACELVGLGSPVIDIEKILENRQNVPMIGIWGMGGIGKTTLAKVVYDKIRPRYEACCFLEKVKNKFKVHGVVNLQKELLSKLLLERNLDIWPLDDNGSNIIRDRLSCKKVLIVLDDVDSQNQLKALVGSSDWFNSGSTIIITTRDKHLLKVYGIDDDAVYEVKCLKDNDALKLFCKHAFKQYQIGEDFLDLATSFVAYAKGLPLVLEVVGSFLYGRSISVWREQLGKFRSIEDPSVFDMLRTSFDALKDNEKDVFLNLAFFLNGVQIDHARDVLQGCRLLPNTAFAILIDQALISIQWNCIVMHDILQEMGQQVTLGESARPNKRSRLWRPNDLQYVLTKKKGTEFIKGVCLNLCEVRNLRLEEDALIGMDRLQFLKFYAPYDWYKKEVHLPMHGIHINSEELVYLHWDSYPSKSLPFHAPNIVELDLCNSKIEKLWEGSQEFTNLKRLNLSGSKYLTTTPDLSMAKNIVEIALSCCESLVEVHSSFEHLYHLEILCITDCPSLEIVPSRLNSKVLNVLSLRGNSKLRKCPDLISKDLYWLQLSESGVEQVPQLMHTQNHLSLLLAGCPIVTPDFDLPKGIEQLFLERTPIKQLPRSIALSNSLVALDLCWTAITELPSSIVNLTALEHLQLSYCKKLEILPTNLSKLGRLKKIYLDFCKRLLCIPELPPLLEVLHAEECDSLQYFHSCIRSIPGALQCDTVEFYFGRCFKLCKEARENIALAAMSTLRLAKEGDQILFVILSNKIPPSFPNQAVGSSVTIQATPEFMAARMLLCCVVIECEYDVSIFVCLQCRCQLKRDSNQPGHLAGFQHGLFIPNNSLEQMVLCSFDKPEALHQCAVGDEILFEFVTFDLFSSLYRDEQIEVVKSCAIAFLPS